MKPLVSVTWLSENIDNPNLIILDASTQTNAANLKVEFPAIQIKGARHFDFKNIFADKDNDLPNMLPSPDLFEQECNQLGISSSSKIVVYDNLGIYSSPRVWWMFTIMGHQDVAVLNGGLPAWKKNNLDCEIKKQANNNIGNFKANFNSELIKNSVQIVENISLKNEIVLDARSKNRFKGTIPESRKNLKNGHIPNSINLPFTEILKNGKLKPKEDLVQLFQKTNPNNQGFIFTCGSGVTACILLLAAKIIGYKNISIYDGSWSEWGQLEGVPIEK